MTRSRRSSKFFRTPTTPYTPRPVRRCKAWSIAFTSSSIWAAEGGRAATDFSVICLNYGRPCSRRSMGPATGLTACRARPRCWNRSSCWAIRTRSLFGKVLLQSPQPCRELASYLLLSSTHPGVMRLVMEFMKHNYPVPKALEAFEQRTDPEFVCYVLREFPKRLNENQQKNFKQLIRIDWITRHMLPLEAVPPSLHESLVEYVQATGIPHDDKVAVQKWILLHGSVQGRSAAGQVLESAEPACVRGILFDSLDSEEEDVQAWATSQLRGQGVPEALRLLIERLDSPLAAVREAARGELNSFNLDLLLSIFEHLDRNICLRAGALVQKIDPDCHQKLVAELNNPVRRRRMRAARAASKLGLSHEVQPCLVAMLSDADSQVRRTAAEVLADLPNAEVVAALSAVLNHSSPRVREAEEQSLVAIHNLRLLHAPRVTPIWNETTRGLV